MSPSRDLWFDTNRLPSVRRVVEGDYDTVLSGVENALGTVWNNWQSDWLGEPVTTVDEPMNITVTPVTRRRDQAVTSGGRRGGGSSGGSRGGPFHWAPRFEER